MTEISMPTLRPEMSIHICPVENGWMVRVIRYPSKNNPMGSETRNFFCADRQEMAIQLEKLVDHLEELHDRAP